MAGYKLPKVTQYVKNVGKSVAYASIDAVKANMHGINDFVEVNNDVMKEMYSGIRNYRSTIRDTEKKIKQSNLYKAIEIGAKNMIQDAKTGNFYKDRMDDYSESIIGVDDDFDMEFSSGSSEGSKSSAQILSDSINGAVGAAAISQNTAIAEGTNLMIKSNSANTKLIMSQMDRISANFSSGMGAVYSGISATNQFLNGPMLAHLENSRRYYEETTKLLRDQTMMTKELLEMQRNLYKKSAAEAKESRYDQSTTGSGNMNIRGYLKNIKSNVRDLADANGLGMFDMGGGGNPFLMFAASPFRMMLEPLAQRLMSKDFKKAVKSFDQGMSTFFSQMVAKLNNARDTETGLFQIIGEIFGIKLDKKKNINPGAYNKGAVPFDGVTRQAIIETIPGYLARIEAAISKGGERHYDYQSGTWKSAKQIQKSYDDEYNRSVANANMAWMDSLKSMISDMEKTNKELAAHVKASSNKMARRIYDDGGDFDPSKGGSYYGMDEKTFTEIMKVIPKNAIRAIAGDTMKAIQDFAKNMKTHEDNGGVYRHLFNGAYDESGMGNGKKHDPSGFKTNNILTLATDKGGKNVFYYLREILNAVSGRHKNGIGANKSSGPQNRSRAKRSKSGTRSGSSSSSSSSDSSDDGPDLWATREQQEAEKAAEEAKKIKFDAKKWIKDKMGDGPVGKALGNILGGAANLLSKPMDYATKLLKKADESMFQMMFGNKEYKLRNGETATNVFQYIIDQVKGSFDEVRKYLKETFTKFFDDHIKPIVQPLWEKYAKPVWEEMKGFGRRAKDRVKQTYDRASGAVKHAAKQRMYNNLFGADNANTLQNGGVINAGDVAESAFGRIVTKRGLTMISPGEIIIPASFDKKEQSRMLAEEKQEKRRILKAIGHNAAGTVDTAAMKSQLQKIYNDNIGKGAKNTASGIIGAGAGLLAGVNPLLGAAAGAGLSILSNSETLKSAIFGKEILEDGTREGGIVSNKIQKLFKKSATDMGDFGIAGGLLGLFTPFGPLGGAVIGAGIGMLKNSEGFKKFIFGDAETGKDGLISKETYNKAVDKIKSAVPNIAVGAVGGALLGPFGLLGNAVMGAGLGLLSSTDTFHEFIFGHKKGEKYDPEKGPRKGLAGAIERGIIDPAKERIVKIIDDFKGYAKKNILEPMKNFFQPFTQALKNIFSETANKIKDHLNDMFERTIGVPIHDFLQEKLFKPMTKFIFGIIKAPLNIGKAMVAAPMRALGGIGNSMRMGQIKRGTAYDMTAQERLDFRQKHGIRSKLGQMSGSDRMMEQDQILANIQDPEQLQALINAGKQSIAVGGDLYRQRGEARDAVGKEISKYFNTKDSDGKIGYDKMKYSKVKKFAKMAADGDLEGAKEYLAKQKGLSDSEKDDLISRISKKVEAAYGANAAGEEGHGAESALDKELSKILGHKKFRGLKDRRRFIEQAERELKARQKGAKTGEAVVEDASSPEEAATNNLTDIYKEKTDDIIDKFKDTNEILKNLYNKVTGESWKPKAGLFGKKSKDDDVEEATTITPEDVENAPTSARGGKAKKKGFHMLSPGEMILSAKQGIQSVFGKKLDKDSKEAVEQRHLEERKLKAEETEAEEAKKTSSILSVLKDKIVGVKDKAKEKGEGLLGKLTSGFGKFWKFMGVGGKVALAAGGISLLGHATQWFKESVWPTIKEALFGKENTDGTKSEGLLGGFGNKLSEIFYGKNGEPGVLAKAGTWIGEKLAGIKKWYDDQGGLGGILCNKVLPNLINGWGYAMNNIVTPVAAVIFRHLPGMLLSLAKALLNGLKYAIWNKDYSRGTTGSIAGGSEGIADLQSTMKSTNSALESSMGTFGSSIKNAYATSMNGISSTASSAAEVDWSSLYGTGSERNSENAGGISGLLGETNRTNEIEYDANGNIVTTYTQRNTSRSPLSAAGDAVGRSFMRGLADDAGTGILGKMANMGTKGTKMGTGATGFFTKHGTGLFKKGLKTTGKAGTAAQNAGLGINAWIKNADNMVQNNMDQAAMLGDDVLNAYWDDLAKKQFGSTDAAYKYATNRADDMAATVVNSGDDIVKNAGSWKDKIGGIFKNKSKDTATTAASAGVDAAAGKVTKEVAEEAGESAVKALGAAAAKEGGEELAKKGAMGGIKKIFSSIANSKIGSKILGFLSKAGTKLGQNALSDGLNKVAEKIGKNCIGKMAGKGLTKIANAIAGFSPLAIAFMLADFLWGWNNAYTILGVAKTEDGYTVSVGQKIICGLLNLLNNRFLFGLIPTETLVDIFVEILAPLFGMDVSELTAARSDEEINRVLDAWNKAHPEEQYDNLEDFNNKDKWTTKAGKALKKTFGGAWDKTKEVAGKALEGTKNLAGKAVDGLKNVGGKVAEGFKAAGAKAKELGGKALDIGTFVKDYFTSAMKFAVKGEEYNIDDMITEDDPLGGVKRTLHSALKIPFSIIGAVAKVGSMIFNKIKEFAGNVKDGFSDAWGDIKSVGKGEYTVFSSQYWKFNNTDEENPLGTISKVAASVLKVLAAPQAMVGWVGSKIWQGIKSMAAGLKEGGIDAAEDVKNVATGKYTVFSSQYWKFNNEGGEENEMSMLGKISSSIFKVLSAPKAMVGWVGSKIWQGIKSMIAGAKEGATDASTDINAVKKGQYTIFSGQYWKSDTTDDGNELSGLGKIAAFMTRLFNAPSAMVGYVGSKVKAGFNAIISGAKEGAMDASADIEAVKKGEYTIFSKYYWKSDKDEDSNPLSKIGSIAAFMTRLFNAPQAMLGYVMTKVKKVFTDIIDGAKDVDKENDEVIEKAKKGDISVFSKEYWKMPDAKNNPLGLVGTIVSFIDRLTQAPIVIFTKVFNKIKEKFDSIKGWFSKLFGEDAEEVDDAAGKGKGGYGRRGYRYGMGPGKVSQLDPSVAGIQYNGHTIGEAGCGPVAATNLINSMGGNVSVQDAANYATAMGFKGKNDGTKPRYMNSILSASGIPNQTIQGAGQIDASLRHGDPVVLMGKGSSKRSPYGNKTPHYITAMGYDRSGNVIVDDPYESGYKSYSKSSVLNGVMNSVSVGGRGRGAFGKRRRYRYGLGMDDALKAKIISKTFEITNGAEGNYDTVTPNDNGSWSVGIAQFHGDAKIRPLFTDMAAKLSGSAKAQAQKYATWGGKILTSSEAAEVKAFLNANHTVSKEVQDKHLAAHVESNMTVPLSMYNAGTLKDYRSIILAADIGNTGPAHLSPWSKVYSPTSQDQELAHVRDSLKTQSWWGTTGKQYKYYQGWMNRIDNTYNKLSGWTADGYEASINTSGSSSGSSESGSNGLMAQLSNLGTSMLKSMFGVDVYEALYGSSSSDSTGSSSGSSGGSVSTSEVKRNDGSTVTGNVSDNEHIRKAQIAVANHMYTRQGKNSYSQNGAKRETQGSGGSDCSSMCSWAYRQALNNDTLTNSLMGSTLPGWSGYTGSQWGKGTLVDTNKDTSKLQVGDLLFWGKNGTTSHVEMYTGDDTIMGHGSGVGPREKKLSTYNHSHPYMGARRYLTEDVATQAGYGKGTGSATSALQSYSDYSGSARSYSAPSGVSVSSGSYVDYSTFLQTIVTVLTSIADNTGLLAKVLEILSSQFGLDFDKTDIERATSKSKAQTEKALNELVKRTSGNTVGVSKLLNNKDTEYVLAAMKAIATE